MNAQVATTFGFMEGWDFIAIGYKDKIIFSVWKISNLNGENIGEFLACRSMHRDNRVCIDAFSRSAPEICDFGYALVDTQEFYVGRCIHLYQCQSNESQSNECETR